MSSPRTLGAAAPPPAAFWSTNYHRPALPLDPDLPQPDAFPFQLPQPFGSLPLAAAHCCPYSNFPLPLPDLPRRPRMVFMLGAQKAGTTSLFQLLMQHPHVAPWKGEADRAKAADGDLDKLFHQKEIHFMARPPSMTGLNYASVEHYYLRGWRTAPDDAVWMDATPGYMHLPVTACRCATAVHVPPWFGA